MPRRPARHSQPGNPIESADLQIIGGKFRGTRLVFEPHQQSQKGHPAMGKASLVTRPMKHRVREAIFNLVGMQAAGKHAMDLFAGTGALGIEAISRGALSATFIERHVPTARVVRENIESVGLVDQTELLISSAFVWGKADLATWSCAAETPQATRPWLVFVSPPYSFFVERADEMLGLIHAVKQRLPPGSLMLVEADERFDFSLLEGGVRADRHDSGWDVRTYSPAVVGVWREAESEEHQVTHA
ncbi:RsmD family RNA methyltransferase [Botrimarina hoheduenensis]|uniref:Ribosomal RNA small subunit methyltransferase D n=1 Tax=Botrimarina hoheduenensis TaxID=2528000 RepID=A0A5C5WCP4_9BACT|nr:RsmD family RNA methyltransferase [Botrimarina hoheduenensis]TWT47442.1 Ribosomal RNA small subunit methyltransferase D [Botrimarina hoheduenensis]